MVNIWSSLVLLLISFETLLSILCKIHIKNDILSSLGFPGGASGKEPICQCRRCQRHSFDLWVRKIPGVGNGNLLQCSCLEKSRGTWQATVHGVTKELDTNKGLSTHASLILLNTVLVSRVYSKVIQLYIHMYLSVFQILSHLGYYHRALSRVPCATQ